MNLEQYNRILELSGQKELDEGAALSAVGKGIAKGAQAVGKGAVAAGKGLAKGAKVAGKGIAKGVQAVGKVANKAGQAIDQAKAVGKVAQQFGKTQQSKMYDKRRSQMARGKTQELQVATSEISTVIQNMMSKKISPAIIKQIFLRTLGQAAG